MHRQTLPAKFSQRGKSHHRFWHSLFSLLLILNKKKKKKVINGFRSTDLPPSHPALFFVLRNVISVLNTFRGPGIPEPCGCCLFQLLWIARAPFGANRKEDKTSMPECSLQQISLLYQQVWLFRSCLPHRPTLFPNTTSPFTGRFGRLHRFLETACPVAMGTVESSVVVKGTYQY